MNFLSADRDDVTAERLKRMRQSVHPDCVVCNPADRLGLRLEFEITGNGAVAAEFLPGEAFQGYSGLMHGGVISLLLDQAMTNCLFAAGITAVTGEINIRYLRPVAAGPPVLVTASLKKSRPPLYLVEAELFQENKTATHAVGKFMQLRPKSSGIDQGADREVSRKVPEK